MKSIKLALAMSLATSAAIANTKSEVDLFKSIDTDQNTIGATVGAALDAGYLAAAIAVQKNNLPASLKSELENLEKKADELRAEKLKLDLENAAIKDLEEKTISTHTSQTTTGTVAQAKVETVSTFQRTTVNKNLMTEKYKQNSTALAAVEARMTQIRRSLVLSAINQSFKVIRSSATVLVIIDAASRAYIWTAEDKNPTFSPVLTYTIKKAAELAE